MSVLIQKLIEQGFVDRIISDTQLARVLGGSAQRRYGLVNRALKAGDLLRVKRGIYVLAEKFRKHALHPFQLAQSLCPGSYVSMETALAYHSWIPEAVFTTASITPLRKSKQYSHPQLGHYTFHPLSIHQHSFLELVDRIQINDQTMLVAKPLRALFDLICYRKLAWSDLEWIESGLRIDPEILHGIDGQDFNVLKSVYKQKRVRQFITNLEETIMHENA